MKKGLRIALILFFCGFLLVMDAFTVVGRNRDHSDLEKRELASFPKVSVKRVLNGKFQKGFVSFVTDHFAFRDNWVEMKSLADIGMGKKEVNGVYIGKDSYLIEKYDDNDFKDSQIKENVKYLSKFVNMAAESMGAEHIRIALVPGKEEVLSDYLPPFVERGTKQDYLLKKLDSKINDSDQIVLDLTDELKKHQDEEIYYRTDHHWTTKGASIGYEEIMKSLGREDEAKTDYDVESVTKDFYGTSYNKIHVKLKADSIEKYEIPEAEDVKVIIDDSGEESDGELFVEEALDGADKYEYFLGGNYSGVEIDTNRGTKKKDMKTLVLIKDSYSNCLVPFFTANYDRIFMIDLRYANSSIFDKLEKIEKFDDIVFVYNKEKFMQDGHQYYLS
ncbi:MAG: hypothetical protein K6F77_07935 [Lachnospiraceae bacterium]|nr:hypothetical protein [Lachnospiraceae bacterium]